MTIRCQNCGRAFEALKTTSEYCSGRCRAEASRKRKAKIQDDRDRRVRHLLIEAVRVLEAGKA